MLQTFIRFFPLFSFFPLFFPSSRVGSVKRPRKLGQKREHRKRTPLHENMHKNCLRKVRTNKDNQYQKVRLPRYVLGTCPNVRSACPCLMSREARPRSGVCCAPPEEASKKICVRSKYWPRHHQGEVTLREFSEKNV